MRLPHFCAGSYPSLSPSASLERTINFYPTRMDSTGAKAPVVLYPTPGVEEVVALATNPVRALFTDPATERVFTIGGDTLYEITYSGGTWAASSRMSLAVPTLALDVGSDPATINTNGDGGEQLFITSGDKGYIYDLAGETLTEEVASGAFMGAVIDGYFLYLNAASSTFYASDLNDGTTWGSGFQLRSKAPDRWQSMVVAGTEIYLLGSETSEAWMNDPAATFPFTFNTSIGVIPFGIAAPWSAKAFGTTAIWLAQTKFGISGVVQVTGGAAQIISTEALTVQIQAYAESDGISDAVADAYEYQGHLFYQLTFPTANATWVYDLSTKEWHERGTWDSGTSTYDAWRPLYHAVGFGKHLIGDREDGTIYELRGDLTSDVGGVEIRRLRRTPVLADQNKRLLFTRFELDLEPGLGTVSGQGSNPQVTLNFSNDAGKTWATAGQRTAGSGPLGEYKKRVFWTRLGSARLRVFEVVMTDPIPWRLVDAYVTVAGGTEVR